MKQLKYFTTDKDVVDQVQRAVSDSGLPLAKMKVFERDNADHRFDGLVLQSAVSQASQVARETVTLFVSLAILGAAAISAGLLSFGQFALLGILSYALARLVTRPALASQDAFAERKKVYFIVVSVDGDEKLSLSHALSHHSSLTTQ